MSSVSTSGHPDDDVSPVTPTAEAAKKTGASLKPNEIALDTVAGKKKSKFWFYAVEPIPGAVGGSVGPSPQAASHVDVAGAATAPLAKSDRSSIPPEISNRMNTLMADSNGSGGSAYGSANGNGNGNAHGTSATASSVDQDRSYTPSTGAADSNMDVSDGD